MSNYNRSNPFDDDDDDIGFGNRGAPVKSAYSKDSSDELAKIQARIARTEDESLESTQRALRALNEAQDTGAKTAAVRHSIITFYMQAWNFESKTVKIGTKLV